MKYLIYNERSGVELGTYEGDSPEDAIQAMLDDAGCDDEPSADLRAIEVQPSSTMKGKQTMIRCISDRYDPSGAELYDNVEDFLAMCESVFGECPHLCQRPNGWYDHDGLVLIEVQS